MAVLRVVEPADTVPPDRAGRVQRRRGPGPGGGSRPGQRRGPDRPDRPAGEAAGRGRGLAGRRDRPLRQSQLQEQLAADIDPKKIGRGIADQIALACHLSPFAGARRLTTARARKHAYQADRRGYLARGRTERRHRRVGLRPRPDTMTSLTGYLPAEQGVACYAALRRRTDAQVSAGDSRSRDRIMADTMVELLTGQTHAGNVAVEVQLTMPLDSLIDSAQPAVATLGGYGPLPADLARDLVTTSEGEKWWRRLFTTPTGHSYRSRAPDPP